MPWANAECRQARKRIFCSFPCTNEADPDRDALTAKDCLTQTAKLRLITSMTINWPCFSRLVELTKRHNRPRRRLTPHCCRRRRRRRADNNDSAAAAARPARRGCLVWTHNRRISRSWRQRFWWYGMSWRKKLSEVSRQLPQASARLRQRSRRALWI